MFGTARLSLFAILLTPFLFMGIAGAKTHLSDEQVKQKIIESSISAYPGPCACPYNSMRNGRACGGRSAWSKAGGYSPICYKEEVTKAMITRWRANHSKN